MNKFFMGLISIILIYFSTHVFAQGIYDSGSNTEQTPSPNQASKQKPEEYKSKVTAASEKVMTALSQELQQQLSAIPNVSPSTTSITQTTPGSAAPTAVALPQTAAQPSIKSNPLYPAPAPKPAAPAQTPAYTGFGNSSPNSSAAQPASQSKPSQFNVY